MLNKIEKGMSNAAEKINENFEALGFESGENENGTWAKFPDGTMICRREVQLDFKTTGQENFDFPVTFEEYPLILTGIREGTYDPYVGFITSMVVGVDDKYSRWQVTKTKTSNVSRPMVLGAIGRWK